MDADQFYMSKRIDKYPPDGHLSECKKCLTRHVDNWDPQTFLWILEEVDVPYIEDEWTKIMDKYCKDRTKVTGTTVLGRYLSKMKLKQYINKHWSDTEKIKAEQDQEKKDAMIRQGYDEETIQQAIDTGTMPDKPEGYVPPSAASQNNVPESIDMLEPEGFIDDLTDDDKKMLTIKWGKTYKPYEWIQLEKYYQEMMNSFDIQTPSHEDYLKLICKTSLKAHQLIDLGDIESFQKMSKVYDALMKSAKFTAAQNKQDNGEFMNSISELVAMCEREGGFIPRYYTDGPQDKVDYTLRDMQNYTASLIKNETNLGDMIEGAVKALQRQTEKEQEDDEDIDDEDTVFDDDDNKEMTDEDLEEYFNFIENQKNIDEDIDS